MNRFRFITSAKYTKYTNILEVEILVHNSLNYIILEK